MIENKGKLIFDESSEKEIKKYTMSMKVLFLTFSIFFIYTGLAILFPSISIFEINSELGNKMMIIRFMATIIILLGFYSFFIFLGVKCLQVYEYGIRVPQTPPFLVLKHGERYIPFESIKEIYWRAGKEEPSNIILEVINDECNKKVEIPKRSIKNMNKFIDSIKDKTKVRQY